MKKTIQYIAVIVSLFLANSVTLRAADLIVTAGGAGGTYATLAAAIAAANANDRILVTPQANNAAFIEGTLAITKSLQILSATEGAYFIIDGNINITPASAAINVTIEGMKLLTGGIQSTIASPTGARSTINLLYDSLAVGAVSFNHDNYNLICASNYIQNGVTFRFGKILGNVIRDQVVINTDASTNNPTDTVQIIGNKITMNTSANTGAITWNSTSQFYMIHNNFITLSYTGASVNYGIWSTNSKASSAGKNSVNNNTIYKPTGSINYGIPLNNGVGGVTEVMNNLVVATMYNYAYSANSNGLFDIHYNYATNFNWNANTNDGTNQTATNVTLNSDGLCTNATSNTINGGNPDAAYDDLNLTRNDAGCYGGSFSLANFHPIVSNDWTRVIMLNAPRRVMVNGTINIQATGFDK